MPADIQVGIDPGELRRFEDALGRLVRQSGIAVTTVVFKVMFDLLRDIIRGTPVDTGRARAAWTVWHEDRRVGAPPIGRAGPAVGQGMQEGRTRSNLPGAAQIPDSVRVRSPADAPYTEVTNFVRYILPLEFGWSRQAPQGFVRKEVGRHARHFMERLRRAQ